MIEEKRDLWQEYLYYTRELKKFLLSDDLDMFLQLLQERERLQQKQFDPPSRAVYTEIEAINRELTLTLTRKKNQLERQNQVSQAYDTFSQIQVGQWMDNKR